ncbi:hypothetical protein HMPREF9630_01685 [Peptoanaerobacter stomatis]|uniref:PF06103 family protein n=1 Tax=Peptoanaerobacter stomatis TaxID=796937 RepID=J6HPE8_9FIRM|nr:DUF948 domain-containing protein [Peptoanaerobacter stomatis]EHL17453.1 hypothetical protein HMPREF9630_01685 [Peptoanaerobacter stomatis]EJU24143.1 PF06103 family protein [Peptoanaerobacter stomatis]NWO25741.1 DUF948 domain-containing protein [Peptostreptococcaceae bacterium oral taxon 081]
MWEVGILLIGVGFLFFSVYLGMVLKNASDTIKEVNRIIIRNSREIEELIISSSGILTSVNSLSGVVSGVSRATAFSAAAKGAMSIAQMRKNRQKGRN